MEQVKTRSKLDVFLSRKYKVIFHNDNYTTYDFVMYCLINIFEKDVPTAIKLTCQVDQEGVAIAGNGYTKDIAETKKNQVITLAKEQGFPFQVSVEEE